MVDKITNHVDQGLAALIEQYRDSTNLKALLSSFVARAQGFEDVSYDVLVKRGLEAAEGQQLDDIGLVVNQPRAAEDDDLYRVRLRARIKTNISEGTVENLITILKLITNTSVQVIDNGFASASISITSTTLTNEVARISGQFSADAKPVGIELTFTWRQQDRPMFRMAVATALSSSISPGVAVLPTTSISPKFPKQGTLIIGEGLATEEEVGYSDYNSAGFTVSGTVTSNSHDANEYLTLKRDDRGFSSTRFFAPRTEDEFTDAFQLLASGGWGFHYFWHDHYASPLTDSLSGFTLTEQNPENIVYNARPKRTDIPTIYLKGTGGFEPGSTGTGNIGSIDHIMWLWVGVPNITADAGDVNYICKSSGSGARYELFRQGSSGKTIMYINDGTDSAQSEIDVEFENGKPLILMAALDRDSLSLRLFAWQDGIAQNGDGIVHVGTAADAAAVGAINNSEKLQIGGSTPYDAAESYVICVGIMRNTNFHGLTDAGGFVMPKGDVAVANFINYTGLASIETVTNGVLSTSLMIKSSNQDRLDKLANDPYQNPTQIALITPPKTTIRYPGITEYSRILETTVSGLWYPQTNIVADEGGNASYGLTASGINTLEFSTVLHSPIIGTTTSGVIHADSATAFSAGTSFIDLWAGTISAGGTSTDPTSLTDTTRVFGRNTDTPVGRQIVCGDNYIAAALSGFEDGGSVAVTEIEHITNPAGRTFFDGTPLIIASLYEKGVRFRLYVWHRGVVYRSTSRVPAITNIASGTQYLKIGASAPLDSATMDTVMASTSIDADVSVFNYETLSYLATYLRFQ